MDLSKYLGKTFYGFCNGYFGRNSYSNKKVVSVGENYIVAENEYGYPMVAIFENESEKEVCELVEEWMQCE